MFTRRAVAGSTEPSAPYRHARHALRGVCYHSPLVGRKNSSLTCVQPVFNALLDLDPEGKAWLDRLLQMAAATKEAPAQRLRPAGSLVPVETPAEAARLRFVFERIVPPPTAFLRWLLQHPQRMAVPDSVSFGTKSALAIEWRRKLFSADPEEQAEATTEGLRALEQRGAGHSIRQWWAFEGFSHIDCCLIAENLVLFVEGKRTEGVSPSTLWFSERSQLWRNVEAAGDFSEGKDFAVILAVETEGDGTAALAAAAASLRGSYPHLEEPDREQLFQHLLGFVTWRKMVDEFGLPGECLVESLPV